MDHSQEMPATFLQACVARSRLNKSCRALLKISEATPRHGKGVLVDALAQSAVCLHQAVHLVGQLHLQFRPSSLHHMTLCVNSFLLGAHELSFTPVTVLAQSANLLQ